MPDDHEEFSVACPACGEENPPEFPVCWSCHADLPRVAEVEAEAEAEARPDPPVPEGMRAPRDRLLFELIVVLVVLWLPSVASGVFNRFYPPPPRDLVSEAFRLMYSLGSLALVGYLVWREGPVREALGLRVRGWSSLLGWSVVMALIPAVGMSLILSIPAGAFFWLPREAADVFTAFDPEIRYLLPFTLLLSAFEEEVIFRAFLCVRLAQVLGDRVFGVLLAAALFAAAHVYLPVESFNTFLSGLFWGWFFLRTRRLWPLVIGHWAWNMLLFYR